jgi:hypothetical protein
MRGMVGGKMPCQQFAQFPSRRLDLIRIVGLAPPYDASGHTPQADSSGVSFLPRTPQTENLKPAQFRDLQITIIDIALIVQEDFDLAMPFEPGDRVDCNAIHFFLLAYARST